MNKDIEWADNNGIEYDLTLIEKPATRGVYGIFVEEECVYIGSANLILERYII